jgi:hypothetical protein
MSRWFDRSVPNFSAHDFCHNLPRCSLHPPVTGRVCRGSDPVSDGQKQALFTRAIALLWAGLSVVLALQWSRDLSMLGFPDGYISPFASATRTLLSSLTAACLAQGLYFFLTGLFGKAGALNLCLQILVAAILTVAPVLIVKDCPRSQLCSMAYEALTETMMDDGAGG